MCLKPFWDFGSQKCWPNKIFGPKNFQVRKYVGLIKCWVEKILSIKNLGLKEFGSKQILGQIEFLVPKNFRLKKMSGPKKFWAKRNVGPKNDGSKIILCEGLVKIRLVLAEIFHNTETRTNVAGTNVAWSNVPKTVAN